jgi:hypothetical protein
LTNFLTIGSAPFVAHPKICLEKLRIVFLISP